MANNRLWAVCKICNRAVVLMKYYPSQWYFTPNEMVGMNEKEDFINSHIDVHPESDHGSGETIAFVTEEDERVKLYDFKVFNEPKIYFKDEKEKCVGICNGQCKIHEGKFDYCDNNGCLCHKNAIPKIHN